MKKIIASTILLLVLASSAVAKDLKILTIGNSFSICLARYLPCVVHDAPGHTVTLTSAYISGCPLERHWANIETSEKDPEARQYDVNTVSSDNPLAQAKVRGNINELIKKGDWDIITIQQASPKSWDYATYQPYAARLITYIREHAPEAEIVIQQTWAYNAADKRLHTDNEKGWGFDQTGMFERVRDAYRRLAAEHGLRVIPVGEAVQNARALGPAPVPPATDDGETLTSADADIVGVGKDTIHLNPRGEYLQACVWFGALFGEDASSITFVPPGMDAGYAKTLRTCAQKALVEYKQHKK